MFALGSTLVLSAFLYAGCADSVVDPNTSTVTTYTDPYALLKVDDSEVTDYSEIPTVAEVCDSSHAGSTADSNRHHDEHGGRGPGRQGHDGSPDGSMGRGWMMRGEGRDFGRLVGLGYRHVFAELNLSSSQDSLLRIYVREFRACAEDDHAAYKAARTLAFESLKAAVEQIRASVDNGTITREEAKSAITLRVDSYRSEIEPLNAALKAAVAACRATFDTSVEAILTTEQRAIWTARRG